MTDGDTGEPMRAVTDATGVNGAPRIVADRYRLLAELGRGGMGVVWRAEDTVIGRQVAVKELVLPDGAEDESGVFGERVLREVRAGGKVNDPAVVTVYDVVVDGATTFIVMELVEAPTLSVLVTRHGVLPGWQAAAIGEQVLSALGAAHEAGIVHRDVKPGNIMVASNGTVKLTDFGIAQAADDPRLTTSGRLVGSPAFVAPERVAGQEASPASDLWALGTALFFAVEGRLPFERATTAATLHAIMNEVPYLTRAQGPLASAITGLLIASPEARISASQARELLSTAAREQAPQAVLAPTRQAAHTPPDGLPPADRPTAAMNPGRRKAVLVGAAVAGVALLVAGFFLGKPVWEPSDSARAATLTYGWGGDVAALNRPSGESCLNTEVRRGVALNESNWVECDQLHVGEAYRWDGSAGTSDKSDGGPRSVYPGLDRMTRFGEGLCESDFHSNTFPDDVRESMEYVVLVPTQREWERPTDHARFVYCIAMRADGGQFTEEQKQSTW